VTSACGAATRWLFTCEHGGRNVPPEYADLFSAQEEVLASHRGWDAGALHVFGAISPTLADAAFGATTTRLLVDLNRSLNHPRVFSEITRRLPLEARAEIANRWWRPWRESVARTIAAWLEAGDAVRHVSVHSFTPELEGAIRNADIGLLYDPRRAAERELCLRWQAMLEERGWRVRRNYPYLGTTDGHTSALRRQFGIPYAGVELELNQAMFPRLFEPLTRDLLDTLAALRNAQPSGR
jgi:predicted N-formylglutamate amidohydrolase